MIVHKLKMFSYLIICSILLFPIITVKTTYASSVSYTYYANGRLWKAIYDNGTTVIYFYDAAGNRTKVTVTCSGTGC